MIKFSDPRLTLKRMLIRSTWIPAQKYDPPFLWSKGISRYCDFRGPDYYRYDETESRQPESFFRRHYAGASGLVWVRLSTRSRHGEPCDLDNFVRGALPTIREPFSLMTTDGDASVPSDLAPSTIEALLGNPWLVSWHTQNYDGYAHPRLFPFPIGMDFHTPRFCASPRRLAARLKSIRDHRLPLDQVPLRVFCDLEENPALEERNRAVTLLRNCGHVDFLKKRVSQTAIWRRYAGYPLVISASGNGLDCHRTWELLYLGVIVITKTSSLDPLFEGLPVAVVTDWEEVHEQKNLVKWLQKYGDLTAKENVWKRLDPNRVIGSIRETLSGFSNLKNVR